jgi:hypothetical protein
MLYLATVANSTKNQETTKTIAKVGSEVDPRFDHYVAFSFVQSRMSGLFMYLSIRLAGLQPDHRIERLLAPKVPTRKRSWVNDLSGAVAKTSKRRRTLQDLMTLTSDHMVTTVAVAECWNR